MSDLLLPITLRPTHEGPWAGVAVMFGGRHLFGVCLHDDGTLSDTYTRNGEKLELPKELEKAIRVLIAKGQVESLRRWSKDTNEKLARAEALLKAADE